MRYTQAHKHTSHKLTDRVVVSRGMTKVAFEFEEYNIAIGKVALDGAVHNRRLFGRRIFSRRLMPGTYLKRAALAAAAVLVVVERCRHYYVLGSAKRPPSRKRSTGVEKPLKLLNSPEYCLLLANQASISWKRPSRCGIQRSRSASGIWAGRGSS